MSVWPVALRTLAKLWPRSQKDKVPADNGPEFIGCFRQDRTRDGFERIVEGFGAKHKRISVHAWNYNSDVETVHRAIEDEFYDLEVFEGIKDFHRRVASYPFNSNKGFEYIPCLCSYCRFNYQ